VSFARPALILHARIVVLRGGIDGGEPDEDGEAVELEFEETPKGAKATLVRRLSARPAE
jgi:hypothetical protein